MLNHRQQITDTTLPRKKNLYEIIKKKLLFFLTIRVIKDLVGKVGIEYDSYTKCRNMYLYNLQLYATQIYTHTNHM